MATFGPLEFYRNVQGANYPAVLYLLWPVAGLFHGEALRVAVKAISIPFDLLLGVALYAALIGRTSRARATVAASLYLLNPAAIIAGAYWGQLDSLGTLPLVGALVALGTRRYAAATALAVLAGLIKPQFGLVLCLVGADLAMDLYRRRAWRPAARSLAAGAFVVAAVAVPLRLSVSDLIGIVRKTADLFPYGSLYALNPWGVFTGFWQPDRWTTVGGGLLVVGLLLSAAPLWRRRDLAAVLAAGVFVTFAFYFLPTRVHERYLFPAVALLAVFAATRRRMLLPYLALTACFTYGLVFALWSDPSSTFPVPQWFAATVLSRHGVIAMAIVLMGTAALIVWRLGQDLFGWGLAPVTAATRVSTPAASAAASPAVAHGAVLRPTGEIPGLTALRFPAAAAVVLYHFRGYLAVVAPGLAAPLSAGWLGVDVFFILSGFILTYNYVGSLRVLSWRGYGQFLVRRFARIYPVHIFTIFVFLALLAVGAPGRALVPAALFPWADLPANLALVQGWPVEGWSRIDGLTWNFPSWSLSAEWFVYLLFPLAVGALAAVRSARLAVAGAALALALELVLAGPFEPNPPALLRIACEFALGCFLARLFLLRGTADARKWAIVAAVSLSVAVIAVAFFIPDGDGRLFVMPLFGLGIFALASAWRPGALSRPLTVLVFLGQISYALYMLHAILFRVALQLLPPAGFAALGPAGRAAALLGGVVLLGGSAVATYLFVERPARDGIRRVVGAGMRMPLIRGPWRSGPGRLVLGSGAARGAVLFRAASGRVPWLRWPDWSAQRWLVTAVIAVPMLFNAVALLPEVTRQAPNLNDDAMHFLYIQRADEAINRGENVLDFPMPEMELGFSPFIYYQHLPHLAVVAAHRALFGTVSLLTVFDVVRYLLMVGLPLTVYWSMRRLGFPVPAAAASAAVSTVISSGGRFDFEYGSFLFRGFGLFTQLWAIHLTFLTLAALRRLMDKGTGLVWAVAALSALALSHLIYAYMMAFTAALLFLIGVSRTTWRPRAIRLAVLGGATALITSYMWLPFLQLKAYFNVSQPYLESWRFDSFGAPTVLRWLATGDLLDHGRLPAMTALVAIGIVAVVVRRTRIGVFALGTFLMWLVLYFGRTTLGRIADLLPMNAGLHVHRFIGGVDLGAILLVGLAGAAIWQLSARLRVARVAMVASLVILLFAPILQERWVFYADNDRWLDQTATAVDGDTDARTILGAIGSLPQGRVYAGLRNPWGDALNFGLPFNSAKFPDLLLLDRIPQVMKPKISLSLNADLLFDFNDRDLASYELYDVRYAVAATGYAVPSFLRPLRVTSHYTLYEAPTHGLAAYAATTSREAASTDAKLFARIRAWALSPDSGARNYIRFDYPADRDGSSGATTPGCADVGTLSFERLERDRLQVNVSCATSADLVLKMTYHPNWHVTVDGVAQPSFMVSPSFIGVTLPAGRHVVVARYESTPIKTPLLILGLLTFAGVAAYGRPWRRWLAVSGIVRRLRLPLGSPPPRVAP